MFMPAVIESYRYHRNSSQARIPKNQISQSRQVFLSKGRFLSKYSIDRVSIPNVKITMIWMKQMNSSRIHTGKNPIIIIRLHFNNSLPNCKRSWLHNTVVRSSLTMWISAAVFFLQLTITYITYTYCECTAAQVHQTTPIQSLGSGRKSAHASYMCVCINRIAHEHHFLCWCT